jgi:two-component system, OmpR family, aerobic respiration control sensor histidine kinase ArcB
MVLTKKIPMRDEKNEIIGLMGTSIDIIRQKAAEEREKLALMRRIEAEEQLRQAVTIISGSIAHDLSTPICIIRM